MRACELIGGVWRVEKKIFKDCAETGKTVDIWKVGSGWIRLCDQGRNPARVALTCAVVF